MNGSGRWSNRRLRVEVEFAGVCAMKIDDKVGDDGFLKCVSW